MLTNVNYMEGSNYNLASLARMLQDGWEMFGDDECITITKGDASIVFDIVIPTANGAIYAEYFKQNNDIGAGAISKEVVMNIEKAHRLLGHENEVATR